MLLDRSHEPCKSDSDQRAQQQRLCMAFAAQQICSHVGAAVVSVVGRDFAPAALVLPEISVRPARGRPGYGGDSVRLASRLCSMQDTREIGRAVPSSVRHPWQGSAWCAMFNLDASWLARWTPLRRPSAFAPPRAITLHLLANVINSLARSMPELANRRAGSTSYNVGGDALHGCV